MVTSACGANVIHLNDVNGKKCGVISSCVQAAVTQQRGRWNAEAARALKTKEAARVHAKLSLMPEDEVARARVLRLKMTKENRMRARVQVASLSMKYRAVKNAMLAGSVDKAAFEKAYKLTASQIASYRAQFSARQADIEDSWNLTVKRQQAAEAYVANDLQKIEEIYEQTLASLADRYGKRIAYFQSLPIIQELRRCYNVGVAANVPNANPAAQLDPCTRSQQSTAVCPLWEDGLAPNQ